MSLLKAKLYNPSQTDFLNEINRYSEIKELNVITRTLSKGDIQQMVQSSNLQIKKVLVNGNELDCSPESSPLLSRRYPSSTNSGPAERMRKASFLGGIPMGPAERMRKASFLGGIPMGPAESLKIKRTFSNLSTYHQERISLVRINRDQDFFNVFHDKESVLHIKASNSILEKALNKNFTINLHIDQKYICSTKIQGEKQTTHFHESVDIMKNCHLTNELLVFDKNNHKYEFKFNQENLNKMLSQITGENDKLDAMEIYI